MNCGWVTNRIDRYVADSLGPVEGFLVQLHLTRCERCLEHYERRETVTGMLASLSPTHPPATLEVRILSAISIERLRMAQPGLRWARHKLRLGDLLRTVLAPALGGVLIALALVPMLLSTFWTAPVLHANDIPLRILATPVSKAPEMTLPSPFPVPEELVVLAYIDRRGTVYDYRVASDKPLDPGMQSQLANALLTSKFEPARRFGQPILGHRVILYQRIDSLA